MVRIKPIPSRHHTPQDARVLVSQGHAGLLPSYAFFELHQPQADGVFAFVGGHHRRLGTPDQQGAQVNIATFGDTTELGLAA